jgi:hypothetical protein
MDTMNQTSLSPKDQGGSGPLVGIIIIILLLAAGGLYFFKAERGKDMSPETSSLMQDSEDPDVEALRVMGSTDTAASIEEDLEATDLGDPDAEFSDFEGAL